MEQVKFSSAEVRKINGFCYEFSEGKVSDLCDYLDGFNSVNQSIEDVIYSDFEGVGHQIFATYIGQPEKLSSVHGSPVRLIELHLEGTGVTRSYESLLLLYSSLESENVNVLGQICTNLSVRIYVDEEDESGVYKTIAALQIKYKK